MYYHNFKVGDKVRRIKPTDSPDYGFGEVYTVLSLSGSGILVTEGGTYAMASAFELVEEEPKAEDKRVIVSNGLHKVETMNCVYYLSEEQYHEVVAKLNTLVD